MRLGYLAGAFGDASQLSSDITSYIAVPVDPYGWLSGWKAASAANWHDNFATALQVQQHILSLDASQPEYAALITQWNALVSQFESSMATVNQNRHGQGFLGAVTAEQTQILQAATTDAYNALSAIAALDFNVASTVQTVTTQQTEDAAAKLAAAQAAEKDAAAKGAVSDAQNAHAQAVAAQQELDQLQTNQKIQAIQNPTPWGLILGGLAAAGGVAWFVTNRRKTMTPATAVAGYGRYRRRHRRF